jgi:hypothetical protein
VEPVTPPFASVHRHGETPAAAAAFGNMVVWTVISMGLLLLVPPQTIVETTERFKANLAKCTRKLFRA